MNMRPRRHPYHDERQRRVWQHPESVLSGIGLAPRQTFIDVGCGDGYFALPAARIVGPLGRVYGIDVDADALDLLRERAFHRGLRNIILHRRAKGENEYGYLSEQAQERHSPSQGGGGDRPLQRLCRRGLPRQRPPRSPRSRTGAGERPADGQPVGAGGGRGLKEGTPAVRPSAGEEVQRRARIGAHGRCGAPGRVGGGTRHLPLHHRGEAGMPGEDSETVRI